MHIAIIFHGSHVSSRGSSVRVHISGTRPATRSSFSLALLRLGLGCVPAIQPHITANLHTKTLNTILNTCYDVLPWLLVVKTYCDRKVSSHELLSISQPYFARSTQQRAEHRGLHSIRSGDIVYRCDIKWNCSLSLTHSRSTFSFFSPIFSSLLGKMKVSATSMLPALAGVASAAYSKQEYVSGVVHEDIMQVCW